MEKKITNLQQKQALTSASFSESHKELKSSQAAGTGTGWPASSYLRGRGVAGESAADASSIDSPLQGSSGKLWARACRLDAGDGQHRSEQEEDEHAAKRGPHPQSESWEEGGRERARTAPGKDSSSVSFASKGLVQDVRGCHEKVEKAKEEARDKRQDETSIGLLQLLLEACLATGKHAKLVSQ